MSVFQFNDQIRFLLPKDHLGYISEHFDDFGHIEAYTRPDGSKYSCTVKLVTYSPAQLGKRTTSANLLEKAVNAREKGCPFVEIPASHRTVFTHDRVERTLSNMTFGVSASIFWVQLSDWDVLEITNVAPFADGHPIDRGNYEFLCKVMPTLQINGEFVLQFNPDVDLLYGKEE